MTYLLAVAVCVPFDLTKDMLVFSILSSLPDSLACAPPKLLEAFLELLVLLFLLLINTTLPFSIEGFGRPPLLPSKVLDLASKEEHHIRKS